MSEPTTSVVEDTGTLTGSRPGSLDTAPDTLTITRPVDKCDRHPLADAYAVVLFTAGPLYFCDHCWRQHQDLVFAAGVPYLDESAQLYAQEVERDARKD